MGKNPNSPVEPLVRLQAELLFVFHQAWRLVGADPTVADGEKARIAFLVLEHFGMLHRYTANPELRQAIMAKPSSERRVLVEAASRYSQRVVTGALAGLARVAEQEDLDDSGLNLVRAALEVLDEVSVARIWGEALVGARRAGEIAKQEKLLSEALLSMSAEVLPSLECFAGLRQLLKVPAGPDQWWLSEKAEEWLTTANREAERFLNDLLRPALP